jgi:Trp operon repressor
MKEIKEKGFSLDNPAYLAGSQIFTAFTNVPLDRVVKKVNNIRGILSEQTAEWQKIALAAGYSTYDVGLPYYGGWDAKADPTPEEIQQREFDTMKKDTKTKDQIDMLLDLGLTKKEIKALGKENNRVKKIIELQKAKEDSKVIVDGEEVEVVKPKESNEAKLRRQFDSIKAENKPDQVKTLTKFGLTKKEIRDLRYEKNRVEKILELMDK